MRSTAPTMRDEDRGSRQRVGRGQAGEFAAPPSFNMHGDPSRHAAGREQHNANEHDAKVQLPNICHIAQANLHIGDQRRAEDRPKEMASPAHVGHQQDERRLLRAKQLGGRDFEVDGGKAAGDPSEQRGKAAGVETERLRLVAKELDALRIFARRVPNTPERRARQRIDRDDRDETPSRGEIVDLDLRCRTCNRKTRPPRFDW